MTAADTQNAAGTQQPGRYDAPARFRSGTRDKITSTLPGSVKYADAPLVLLKGWTMLNNDQRMKAMQSVKRPIRARKNNSAA